MPVVPVTMLPFPRIFHDAPAGAEDVMRHRGRVARLLSVSWLWLAASGCVDLTAVEEFSAAALQVTAHFPAVAADLEASCVREKELQALARREFQPRSLQPPECAAFREAQPGLATANRVLAEYLRALASLAANQGVTYDAEIKGLAGRLRATTQLPDPAVTAIQRVATFVATATSSAYRRKHLARAVADTAPSISLVTRTLAEIVGRDYVGNLEGELIALDDLYGTAFREHRQDEPLTALLLRDRWLEQRATIEKRIRAAQTYSRSLADLGHAHDRLHASGGQLNLRTLASELQQYGRGLPPVIEALRAAF
jgi:hypothetical protein